jgi:nucleoside-diphosphate-sugar epimerase
MNRLLIVGFGDIAKRAVGQLLRDFEVDALVRPAHMGEASEFPEVQLISADLDAPASLAVIRNSYTHIAHLAPPPATGSTDPRTVHLLDALAAGSSPPQRIVYISTSGVYGNCHGAWVDEGRPVNPATDRARRRVDAEKRIAAFGLTHGVRAVILRVPGIYAADRLPLERLHKSTPVLRPEDDVYTNHIHADDLAAIVVAALTHADAEGSYNACDDSALKMGEWFDLVADRAGLPRPPRVSRAEAAQRIPAPLLSFMSESRRLTNARLKDHLKLKLRYPTVFDGVPADLTRAGR